MSHVGPSINLQDTNYNAERLSICLCSRRLLCPMVTSGAGNGVEVGEDEKSGIPSLLGSCAPSVIPETSVKVERVSGSCSPRERASNGQEATQGLDLKDRLTIVMKKPPPKSDVPNTEQDEAYHFALSTVPLLLSLNKTRRRRAKQEIMSLLDLLNEEEEKEKLAAFHQAT